MWLMTWLRQRFERSAPPRAQMAIDMAQEVAMQARSLREQLEPFRLEDDPFAAINIKKVMAEEHERSTEFGKTPRAKP